MSIRPDSPPTASYSIIDIRNPCMDMHSSEKKDETYGVPVRPPSPPSSLGISEDAFNNSDLVNTILDSLDKPKGQKSIPTYILYDKKGLQLFDQITQLDDEYYLTDAERDILVHRSDELVDRLQDGSVIFELGAGSLVKTLVLLRAIEKKKLHVTYYALDLDQHELDRSLSSLGELQYVKLFGLLGTYDQGVPWISKHFTGCSTQKVFLWMGSSIGNQSRFESAMFLKKIQRMCMEPSDLFIVGFDKRNDPAKIELAYDDSHGITREFIMNGLDHINRIMGQDKFVDRNLFEYHSIYQEIFGRHLSHYKALKDMTLTYKARKRQYNIRIEKDEVVHVEHSFKYSREEIESILTAADLNMVECWEDSKEQYRLVIAEKRPFIFERNMRQVYNTIFPSKDVLEKEFIDCSVCNEEQYNDGNDGQTDKFEIEVSNSLSLNRKNLWPTETLPTLHEWQELWKSWDLVTRYMLDHKTMVYKRPIALRHPFIFYLGHIPAFLDIQLSRHQVDKELGATDLTEPQHFSDIFERGIDPDMDDPTLCNPHSDVPTKEEDWPSVDSIIAYQKKIRLRLARLLTSWEDEAFELQSSSWINATPDRKRQARIVWMCFEHEALHLETLLYMLVQSPDILPPKGVAIPTWKLLLNQNTNAHMLSVVSPLSDAPTVHVPGGLTVLGHHDSELSDFSTEPSSDCNTKAFGWDNESPQRHVKTESFEIDSRPVTNGEYFAYLQATRQTNTMLASWLKKEGDETIYVRTVFGPCPLVYAQNWPVQTNYNEAKMYADYKGGRIPTEPELVRFRDLITGNKDSNAKWANIGFENWYPTDVDNEKIHVLGDVFEWTETVWASHDGFEASEIYPGYSADFFDGKHRVVLGGSWATHPRIAERRSFRNWYQSGYPYVFSGFRLCH